MYQITENSHNYVLQKNLGKFLKLIGLLIILVCLYLYECENALFQLYALNTYIILLFNTVLVHFFSFL